MRHIEREVWDGAHIRRERIKSVWPARRGSIKRPLKTKPWKRADAVKALYSLRAWNSAGSVPVREVTRANGCTFRRPTRYGGLFGPAALRVAECLMLDFGYLFTTGALFPSLDKIAEKTGLGRATVVEALKRLSTFGVVSWVRRCMDAFVEGVYTLVQISNAYTINPPSMWVGYSDPKATPTPMADTWGAAPIIPEIADQAAAAPTLDQAAALYELEPRDSYCRTMARVAKTAVERVKPESTAIPIATQAPPAAERRIMSPAERKAAFHAAYAQRRGPPK